MIQTLTFHVPIGQQRPDELLPRMRQIVKDLLKFQPVILGFQVSMQDNTVVMLLRVAGRDRWKLHGDAKRLALLIARRAAVEWKQVTLVTWLTEPGGSSLTLAQGRPANVKPPRAERKPDGSPWDHIAWWGDDLDGS